MPALKFTIMGFLAACCVALGFGQGLAEEKDSSVRVILTSIEVFSTKADGKAWDIDDGKPDLVISVKNLSDNTLKEVVTEEKKDTLSATYDSPMVLVGAGQKLQILVEDKDIAANDTIGKATLAVTEEMLKKGTHTVNFGRVKSLTLGFRKP